MAFYTLGEWHIAPRPLWRTSKMDCVAQESSAFAPCHDTMKRLDMDNDGFVDNARDKAYWRENTEWEIDGAPYCMSRSSTPVTNHQSRIPYNVEGKIMQEIKIFADHPMFRAKSKK